MVPSGILKGLGRLGTAFAVALVVLVAGAARAQAEPPTVTISTPAPGTLTKESSILFSGGTSDTLDTVMVNVFQGTGTGGTRVREELAVPTGNAWGVQAPSLPDGTYTAVAQQGASEVGFSAEVTFRIDTTAPAVTLEPVPAATSDSTPSFGGAAGTAPGDGESVTVVVWSGAAPGGQEVASGTVAVHSGAWSFTPSSLPDGTYTVQAFQGDAAGNTAASAAATFRVDTTSPGALSLNAVPATIANPTPTFGGAGGKEPGDGAVRVVIDGTLAGEAPVGGGGTWEFTAAHLSDGNHTVRAEQLDEAGNLSKTSTAGFRVDTTAPAPTLTGPKSGETLKSSLVEFHGGAGNATGDASQLTVEIFRGESTAAENLEQSFTTSRSGSSWSTGTSGPRLSNGIYTVRVKQLDSVNNTGVSSAVSFAIESPAPNVTLNELPRFTSNASPSFGGVAESSAEAKPEVTLKIWSGTSASGTLVQAVTGAAPGAWSIGPVKALADGTYTAQAEQPAVAKNPAGVSATTTFTVDTKAPEPTLSAPGETTGPETVSGLAGTAPGDRRQVTAEVFAGASTEPGAQFETITVNASPVGSWSATFADLPSGQYTVLARQSDEAGNAGVSATRQFVVNVPPAPPTPAPSSPDPPNASFTWVPAQPAVGQSVSFVSKSTDASSAITGYGWDFLGAGPFAGGGQVATTSFTTPGSHTVRLQVSDANGLSSIATQTVQVAPQVLTLMQPFPIVRIAGAETAGGVRIRLLSVQAPPAAKIAVSCKGRSCKTKSESRVVTAASKAKSKTGAVTLSFPRFQRSLKAGTVLQIRVSRAGQIGKFTSFTIRRGKLPVRVDACLRPPSTSPSPCPSQ